MIDEEMAADYAETLPELCKILILKSDSERWTRTDSFIDRNEHPFGSGIQIAKHLEASNLVECQQGRMGNRYDCLIVRLNDRGAYLKNYLLAQPTCGHEEL